MAQSNSSLLNLTKSRLVLEGSSLTKWCQNKNLSRQWVTDSLTGKRNGPAAQKLRSQIIRQLKLEAVE